jgi:hypothetical protein
MTRTVTSLAGKVGGLPVRWTTAALFAVVLTYADGFWVTVIQITIGAIERFESPLTRWLRDSTLMLPLVFLAVLVALLLARRWAAHSRRRRGGLAATASLIVLLSGGVGIAEVAASSAYDYSFQVKHLELMHSYGANQTNPLALGQFGPAVSPLPYTLYCNLRGVAVDSAVSLMQYATFLTHVRALMYAVVLVLVTNLAVVAVLLALLANRLWSRRVGPQPQPSEALAVSAVTGALP